MDLFSDLWLTLISSHSVQGSPIVLQYVFFHCILDSRPISNKRELTWERERRGAGTHNGGGASLCGKCINSWKEWSAMFIMESESFHFCSHCLPLPFLNNLPFHSYQCKVLWEKMKCIHAAWKGLLKLSTALTKGKVELAEAWEWLNVYNLTEHNPRRLKIEGT